MGIMMVYMGKSIVKNTVVFLFVYLIGLPMGNAAKLECEEEWNTFYTLHKEVADTKKIRLWQENKSNCKPEGYYYYILSKLYISVGDYSKAKNSIEKGLTLNDQAKKYNQVLMLSIEFDEVSYKSLDNDAWQQFESKVDNFINEYPKFSNAYTLMANVNLARGSYDEAIRYAGRAGYLEEGLTPLIGRILTIAYTEKEKYKEAIQLGNDTSALDNSLFSDKYFMLALVRSYVGVGDIDVASKILKLLVKSNPELKNDNDVQRYIHYLRNKLKEREQLN